MLVIKIESVGLVFVGSIIGEIEGFGMVGKEGGGEKGTECRGDWLVVVGIREFAV